MKIRTTQKALAEAATWAARQVPASPLQPALACLRLHADVDFILSGTNGESSTHSRIDADIITSGTVAVPARMLAGVAAQLPAGSVELAADDTGLTVTADGSQYRLATIPAADYPVLPVMPTAAGTVDAEALAAAVNEIAHLADGTVAALPAMAGVRITTHGDQLTLVATDRYRVAYRTISWQPTGIPIETAVLPARALVDIVKGMTGEAVLALPGPDNMLAGVSDHRRTTMMRVLDAGGFPKVDVVLPVSFAAEAELQAEDLLAAVRRVSVVAEDKTPVRLLFAADTLTVMAASRDIAHGHTTVDCQLEGPDEFRISFAPRYLTDGMQGMTGPVRVRLTDSRRPALFLSAADKTSRYLAVPLKDTWSAPPTAA